MQDALHVAGPQAAHILDLWRLMLLVCTGVFAAVLVTLLLALRHAPRGSEDTPADLASLERAERGPFRAVVFGVVVCTLLLLVLIVASVFTDRALAKLSLADAVNLEVTAHQWWWEVRYDDANPSRIFTTANEMVVPVGRPVVVTLKADDVIHSFWVPSLHGKKDLIPGRTATLQFRADKAGTYRGQCAEFCGFQHAWMAFDVVAEPPQRYEAWAARQRQASVPPGDAQLERGRRLFVEGTCALCHTIQGTPANGRHAPDLTHLGSRARIAAGALPNTQENLQRWIADPQSYKPGVNMPASALPSQDLQALASYLGSLR